MMMHPDLLLAQANDRRRELIAEADQERLLNIARLARRARRARQAKQDPAARGRPAGTLASCEPSAAVPAR
ncbi:hypothetical protein [Phytohabitans rumicis]|uniref:Uncharacterized protein n=1 Tax=Phytohabitans rumicis TaxID=1076125 RepID=A0A6V8LJW8_9ACTN|nr:hypothetical protein [Phytohabitans rumicis]GFJ94367.1 hypothetical protein Prum_080090 [Phytohabitans rumicis]